MSRAGCAFECAPVLPPLRNECVTTNVCVSGMECVCVSMVCQRASGMQCVCV